MTNGERKSVIERIRVAVAWVEWFTALNSRELVVDALAIVGWVVVLTTGFVGVIDPRWAYTVLLVGGIAVYTFTRQPFVLPDEEESE